MTPPQRSAAGESGRPSERSLHGFALTSLQVCLHVAAAAACSGLTLAAALAQRA